LAGLPCWTIVLARSTTYCSMNGEVGVVGVDLHASGKGVVVRSHATG